MYALPMVMKAVPKAQPIEFGDLLKLGNGNIECAVVPL